MAHARFHLVMVTINWIMVGALLLSAAACRSADPVSPPNATQRVTFEDGEVLDPDRSRRIPYRIHYPIDAASGGPLPVVMMSHGGFGNPGGHRSAPWLGPGLAARGYVVLQLAHLPSASTAQHMDDRPRDVSHVLDRLGEGTLPLPRALERHLVADRVAHLGHSFGAYTAHAVGGATLIHGQYLDRRIATIIPFSPQGPDRFGFFDEQSPEAPSLPTPNSWQTVAIPVLTAIGAREMDGLAESDASRPGWRRVPFDRYPDAADRILLVLPGQDHSDLWNDASPAVQAYLIHAVADFLDVVLAERSHDGCTVGTAANALGAAPERRAGRLRTSFARCSSD